MKSVEIRLLLIEFVDAFTQWIVVTLFQMYTSSAATQMLPLLVVDNNVVWLGVYVPTYSSNPTHKTIIVITFSHLE